MQIAVIYNPMAGGTRHRKRVRQLQEYLRNYGHTLKLLATDGPGAATRLACDAVAHDTELVLAVGGDGTINEVIQGLAGSSVPLAVYPSGTTNVWCKQIGMPSDPRRAAEVIHIGPRRTIDLGRAGSRYFLLMAGIGIDAEITRAVNVQLKHKFGKLVYAIEALRLFFLFPGTTVRIVLEPNSSAERVVSTPTSLVVFTNAERYAIVKLAPEARLDDGQLELLVFQTTRPLRRIFSAVLAVFNLTSKMPEVARYQLRHASLEASPAVAVQLDGEPASSVGLLPLEIHCVPAALRVVVPLTAPAHLFSV